MYHFDRDMNPEHCDFGEHCPTSNHFETPKELIAAYDTSKNEHHRGVKSPIDGVAATCVQGILSVLNEKEDYFGIPADRLRSGMSEERVDKLLMKLAKAALINCEVITTVTIRAGAESRPHSRVNWTRAHQRGGAKRTIINSDGVIIMEPGREALQKLTEEFDARRQARSLSIEFSNDAYRLGDFVDELKLLKSLPARLQDPSDEDADLPRITKRFRAQVIRLFELNDDRWTVNELAKDLTCSNQAARTIGRKLVRMGLMKEIPFYSYGGSRIMFVPRRDLVALAGGVRVLLGSTD